MANMQNNFTSRYAFLRALDIEQLEQLLKADYEGSMSEDAAEEFIDAIIEVILEKERENPSGRLVDVDRAWADFQNYYNVPDRNGQLLYPDPVSPDPTPSQNVPVRRAKRILRRVVPVAATIGILMSLLVVAQAAGLDVFGAMARWTDETFNFVTTSASDEIAAFRSALEEQNIPVYYAPSWIPDGFKAEEPQVSVNKRAVVVSSCFSNEQKYVSFVVTKSTAEETIRETDYEKKLGDAGSYSNGNQRFYIFENTDSTTATWSDGAVFLIDIYSNLSTKDIKSIIDSLGG